MKDTFAVKVSYAVLTAEHFFFRIMYLVFTVREHCVFVLYYTYANFCSFGGVGELEYCRNHEI
jgi:hypothetical protein